MPKMSGRVLCEKIRENPKFSKTKIVFLTVAEFSKQGLKKLKDLDVADYIKKPFEVEEFIKRIKKII